MDHPVNRLRQCVGLMELKPYFELLRRFQKFGKLIKRVPIKMNRNSLNFFFVLNYLCS